MSALCLVQASYIAVSRSCTILILALPSLCSLWPLWPVAHAARCSSSTPSALLSQRFSRKSICRSYFSILNFLRLKPSPASIPTELTCSPQTVFFVASRTINLRSGLASAARTDGFAGIITSVAQYQILDDRSIKMDSLQASFFF